MVPGVEALLSLKEVWESLIALDPDASPYLSWNWILSWINVYGQGQEFVTLICRQGNEIVGIIPFSWKKRVSPLTLRKLWMLGFQSGIGSNGLTEEPILAVSNRPAVREKVLSVVHQELKKAMQWGPWDIIAYRRFGRGFEGCSMIESKSNSVVVQQYMRGSEYSELPSTWESFLSTLSKSMRENIPYYPKKLKRDGFEFQIESVSGKDIQPAVSKLVRLHKKRTYEDDSLLHIDYFADPRQKSLLLEAMKTMIPAGQAELRVLKVNNEIIAGQVFLKSKSMMIAHYSGFDPEWAKYSPLFVLQTETFRVAIRDGILTLNLLRGNANWQRRWNAEAVNQIIDVTIAKQTILPRIRQVIETHESRAMEALSTAKPVQRARATIRLRQISGEVA